MKHKSIVTIIFFLMYQHICFADFSQQHEINQNDSLFVLLLMVKNEEAVMQATLQPFLDAHVDNYLILDTGSTDRTIEVTQKLFEDYGVKHGYIVEQPFVDFATSRNYAIEQAEKLFPHAVFFLMIDAEWYMQDVPGLLEFCKEHEHDGNLAYLVLLQNQCIRNYINRLFKAHKGLKFAGVVHECINCCSNVKVPAHVNFFWNPSFSGNEKSKQRWQRDLKLLLGEYEKRPFDPRTSFYIAQTYACLGDLQNALEWYIKRFEQTYGWDQETFIACYRIAEMYNALDNWPQALHYYLKSYGLRPQRIEPLVRLAQHYLVLNDFSSTFIFAYQAVRTAPLQDEVLFIDAIMYDYMRYDILGIASWYVGEYEIGESAVRKALAYNPNAEHLKFNLSLYENRKLKTV